MDKVEKGAFTVGTHLSLPNSGEEDNFVQQNVCTCGKFFINFSTK